MGCDQRSIRVRVALFTLVLVAILTTTLWAADSNPGIAPPNSKPYGASYAEWGVRWWQWVWALPVHTSDGQVKHPLLTNGSVDCGFAQPQDHVWFLVGRMCLTGGGEAGCENNRITANRTCNVPVGTALFLPLLNTELDNIGTAQPTNFSLSELIYWAEVYTQATELHASIDGAPVPSEDLLRYRAAFAPFSYTLPATDSLYQTLGIPAPGSGWPGTVVTPAASDGFYLMIHPLAPGTHVVEFGATTEYGLQMNTTYNITVVPRGTFFPRGH